MRCRSILSFVKCYLRQQGVGYCSSSGNIIVEKVGALMLIGLNRPYKSNALDFAAVHALNQAFDELDDDSRCQIGVIYGVGGNFCSGRDLYELTDLNEDDSAELIKLPRLRQAPLNKFLIGAVEGYAVGMGFELILTCDLIIASETAKFGFLNRRFGVPLLNGGTVKLQKIIGFSRAMDLILTGRCIDAPTAVQWGLSKQTVSLGAALGQTVSLANTLCQFPLESLKADKVSMYYAAYTAQSTADALQFELENGQVAFKKEAKTGAQRFVHDGIGRHGSFKTNKL